MKKTKDVFFILLLASAVCFIFRDILFLKVTFIRGDYLQQFFPWLNFYSESIKSLQLPLWIRSVQCGFPLLAEGQIGVLYPLNLGFFYFLPFREAYNYSFLFHFILSGVFTYLYARKMKADFWGGALAAILICFGSAYAGCFVHIATLKCLVWFPLVLLVSEVHLERKDKKLLPLIGVFVGMQYLSGSFQMAFYSTAMYIVYFFIRNRADGKSFWGFAKDILIVLAVAVAIGLPQIIQTAQLAEYSNRPLKTLDFALWNSLSPAAFLGTFLPYMGMIFSKGNVFYIGMIGLFFCLYAMTSKNTSKRSKGIVFVLVLAVFIALGKYNPLYVWMIKAFNFYTFRAPSRAIYFAVFAASVLAGVGFTSFFNNIRSRRESSLYRKFTGILIFVLSAFSAIKLTLMYYGPQILEIAKKYVAKNIYGKPFHRYSLDVYMSKTENFYNTIINRFSLEDRYVLTSVVMIAGALVVLYAVNNIKRKTLARSLCFGFVAAELFFFSFFAKGINTDLAGFDFAAPKEKEIFNILKADKELFRICPIGYQEGLPLWLWPSMNQVYGFDSIALYSPLANRDYFLDTKGLGLVDDSLGILPYNIEALHDKMGLLKAMNVKYVIAPEKLYHPALQLLISEGDIQLYLVKGFGERFFFSTSIEDITSAEADISVEEYRSGYAEVIVDCREKGFLVFSEKNYSGWEVYVDGKKGKLEKYGSVLQSVRISAGSHRVVFKYDPAYLKIILYFSLAIFLMALLISAMGLFVQRTVKNK